ncbi:MAG TPA: efflux transporter outer membrane subunit [Candidatus Binatia bacterium]|jgi:NodT family efflux transporter outer membrane factor (OMF) lipoprotein|nr:efflux transporter outer membrane subunit [Candidatus Binatia bacterium]
MSMRALVVILLAVLAGCSVGPDYVRPTAPEAPAYKELDGWKVAEPQDDVLRGAWWERYDDPDLSALEERVVVSNQTLAAAEAQLRQARALVGASRSSWYPNVTVGVSASRSKQSSNLGSSQFGGGRYDTDLVMPLSISWEADVWGRIRRAVESSEDTAAATAADLASTQLSLQSELAIDWFTLRTLDSQRQLLDETVKVYERTLTLTRNRLASGVVSRADVVQAETQLESTRAQSIDVGVQRAQLEHAIAVLVGEPASTFSIPFAPLHGEPPPVPVGLPSELLERRPDIAAAERRVASANAEIGVATAAYYPTVTLSATGGFQSGDIAKWLVWPSRFFSVGPAVTQTVYDGGLRASQSDQARATFDATVADYRQSVLTGFQEVEDALSSLRLLAEEDRVQARAVAAAEESVKITTNQYTAGTISYLSVVIVQAAALSNRQTYADIRGRRLEASVRLIQALGGGWDISQLPDAP